MTIDDAVEMLHRFTAGEFNAATLEEKVSEPAGGPQ